MHQAMIDGLDPNHSHKDARLAIMQEVVTIASHDQRVSSTQKQMKFRPGLWRHLVVSFFCSLVVSFDRHSVGCPVFDGKS